MSTSRKGKRVAVVLAAVVVVGLPIVAWQYRAQLRFWYLFESLGLNDQGFPEYRHRMTGIIMVRLPGGTFWMGAQKEDPEGRNYDPDAEESEGPVHEVKLSPFLIAKYEVTQAQWHSVMGDYPSCFHGNRDVGGKPVYPPADRDQLPVERVSWDDIQEFEARTGLTLPTEAQWEYACRGGTETVFSFGSGDTCPASAWQCEMCEEFATYMWYCGNAGRRTHEVGTKQPNPYGLHDIHGNVWEWCEDVWNRESYSGPEAAGPNPLNIVRSGSRVQRGGDWCDYVAACRSAYRGMNAASARAVDTGLRPVYWPLP